MTTFAEKDRTSPDLISKDLSRTQLAKESRLPSNESIAADEMTKFPMLLVIQD